MYIDKLKELRERNNLTQIDIAKVLGMTRGSYSHYETENDVLPVKYLVIICNYFDVSLDYLFKFTNDEKYNNCNSDIDLEKSRLRIKEFRLDNKLTQLKLASFLNSDNSTISKYEKGINIIATPFLYDICKKYNVSADYLLGRTDSPKYLK